MSFRVILFERPSSKEEVVVVLPGELRRSQALEESWNHLIATYSDLWKKTVAGDTFDVNDPKWIEAAKAKLIEQGWSQPKDLVQVKPTVFENYKGNS